MTPGEQILAGWEAANPCCASHAGQRQLIWGKDRADLILRIDAALVAENEWCARIAETYAAGRRAAEADAARASAVRTQHEMREAASVCDDVAQAIRRRRAL